MVRIDFLFALLLSLFAAILFYNPLVHRFVRNLITEWRRLGLPLSGETIVVAVSGGADSMSLLLAIEDLIKRKKFDLRVLAAHFDHKLRTDSFSDLDFVRMFARERGFELAHGEWKRAVGGNLEQTARDARYSFLRKTAENLNATHVLTAHTMNDQAETFLMNLIRGSGPGGLGGMRSKRVLVREWRSGGVGENDGEAPLLPFSSTPPLLTRPLLNWAKRRDTENFCLENGIDFRLDPMNDDLNYRRVWVRKALIPMLEEANPKIVETLCRTAELLRSDGPESPEPETPPPSSGDLDLQHLRTLDKAHLYPVLRDWIRLHRGGLRGITQRHVEAIHDLIHSQKSGRLAEVPGGAALRQNGRLRWLAEKAEKG